MQRMQKGRGGCINHLGDTHKKKQELKGDTVDDISRSRLISLKALTEIRARKSTHGKTNKKRMNETLDYVCRLIFLPFTFHFSTSVVIKKVNGRSNQRRAARTPFFGPRVIRWLE